MTRISAADLVSRCSWRRCFKAKELTGAGHAAGLSGADAAHPAEQAVLELRMVAQVEVDPVPPFEHAGQDVVHVRHRKAVIDAHDLGNPFRPEPLTVVKLGPCMTLAAEENHLAVRPPRCDHEHGVGLLEAGEVVEVAVLAKQIVRVAVAGLHAWSRRGSPPPSPALIRPIRAPRRRLKSALWDRRRHRH